MKEDNTVEAEIVEDEFKAPVLQDIKYPVSEASLNALVVEYANVPVIDLDASDEDIGVQYQWVLKGHKLLAKKRNEIEKTRKAIKDPAFSFGKSVDAFAKKLQFIINGTEDKLKIQRERVEQNEARKQREIEEAEELRLDTIKSKMTELQMLPLKFTYSNSNDIQVALNDIEYPTVEVYNEFLEAVINIYNLSSTQLKQMFDDKILVENAQEIQAQQKLEADAKEAEQNERNKQAQIKFNERQAEFEKKQEDFAQQQREQREAIDRQKAQIEADELLKKQAAEKIEREKQEAIDAEAFLKEQKANIEANEKANKKLFNKRFNETLQVIVKIESNSEFLNLIIEGKVPNVKWSPNEN